MAKLFCAFLSVGLYKDTETRSHTDGFRKNNVKCLKPKGICSFVPNSSAYVFWPFLGKLGKQIATYPLPFQDWKRGLEFASVSRSNILSTTVENAVPFCFAG